MLKVFCFPHYSLIQFYDVGFCHLFPRYGDDGGVRLFSVQKQGGTASETEEGKYDKQEEEEEEEKEEQKEEKKEEQEE